MLRLAATVCMVSFIAGCFNGMDVDVAPPECTVDENSPECSTVPTQPTPMTDEDFFQDETSLMHYWSGMA